MQSFDDLSPAAGLCNSHPADEPGAEIRQESGTQFGHDRSVRHH